MYQPSDEVSLRELYLILRRGFAGIAVTALVVGAAAFAYVSTRPTVYAASATVQLTAPQPVSSGSEVASLVPQVGLGSQAYTSLANGSAVLSAAFAADAAVLREISDGLRLKAIDAANQTRGQLTIEHTARAATAELAAQRANAWAEASAAAARSAMETTVARALAAANTELTARGAELDEAQARWTEFTKDDARVSLRSQIDQLALQQAGTRARLAELNAKIAAASAQQSLLTAGIGAREGRTSVVLADQVRALIDAGVVSEEDAAALTASLGQLPPGLTVGGQDLLNLVDRARLDGVAGTLAALVAERSELETAAERAEATAATLRGRLADLEQRAAEPQAALAVARLAHDRVAGAIPLLALQQRMTADAAQVVIAADPPLKPVPSNRLMVTLAAVLVAGLLAMLFVFLRAAVAPPDARTGASGTPGATFLTPTRAAPGAPASRGDEPVPATGRGD